MLFDLYQRAINTNIDIKTINIYKKYCLNILDKSVVDVVKKKYPNLINKNLMLELYFINDKKMQNINFKYRSINKTTNVLSMQFLSNKELLSVNLTQLMLGEIYISVDELERESKQYNLDNLTHLARLVIHGMLHLFGYDHNRDEDALEMLEIENTLLAKVGINNLSLVNNYWYD